MIILTPLLFADHAFQFHMHQFANLCISLYRLPL